MKKSFFLFPLTLLIIFALSGCSQKKNVIAEDALLGEWYTINGNVEAYSFLKDDTSYIFTGTKGMRPVVYGKWKIDKDKFVIIMDNGTTTDYSFNLLNDTLVFNDGDEIYTRTEPLEIQFPEVRVLRDLKTDLGLAFSDPQAAEISWGEWIDSIHSSKEFSIKGYSISVQSTLTSGDIAKISIFFYDSGFERDTFYMTELCNGFHDNNHLITICATQDPEAEDDSISILISSGFIPR